jgi:hypothetical protein
MAGLWPTPHTYTHIHIYTHTHTHTYKCGSFLISDIPHTIYYTPFKELQAVNEYVFV